MTSWISTLSEVAEAALVSESVKPSIETNAMLSMGLTEKGLLTTAVGLLGVFLVLTLFFITIKVMQGLKTKPDKK